MTRTLAAVTVLCLGVLAVSGCGPDRITQSSSDEVLALPSASISSVVPSPPRPSLLSERRSAALSQLTPGSDEVNSCFVAHAREIGSGRTRGIDTVRLEPRTGRADGGAEQSVRPERFSLIEWNPVSGTTLRTVNCTYIPSQFTASEIEAMFVIGRSTMEPRKVSRVRSAGDDEEGAPPGGGFHTDQSALEADRQPGWGNFDTSQSLSVDGDDCTMAYTDGCDHAVLGFSDPMPEPIGILPDYLEPVGASGIPAARGSTEQCWRHSWDPDTLYCEDDTCYWNGSEYDCGEECYMFYDEVWHVLYRWCDCDALEQGDGPELIWDWDVSECVEDLGGGGGGGGGALAVEEVSISLSSSTTTPGGQVSVTVTITPPLPDRMVTLSVTEQVGSGGHNHSGRPPGTFGGASGLTSSTGQYTTSYQASPFGGAEYVVVVAEGRTDSAILNVRVSGLLELGPGSGYVLVGATTTHPAIANHFGTAAANFGLTAIASAYTTSYPSEVLRYNDQSLPYGGLFDIDGSWQTPHAEHRFGRNCDVSKSNVPASRHSVLEQLFRENGSPNFLDHSSHWHLRF